MSRVSLCREVTNTPAGVVFGLPSGVAPVPFSPTDGQCSRTRNTQQCGIAECLVVDPSPIRVAFVVAALWAGIGLLPTVDDKVPAAPTRVTVERSHVLAGAALIVLGGLLLANLGLAPWLA
jgi:hypothetical protein